MKTKAAVLNMVKADLVLSIVWCSLFKSHILSVGQRIRLVSSVSGSLVRLHPIHIWSEFSLHNSIIVYEVSLLFNFEKRKLVSNNLVKKTNKTHVITLLT